MGDVTTIQVEKTTQERLNKFKHQYELETYNEAIKKTLDIAEALPDAVFRAANKI